MIVHPPVEAVSLITGQLLPDTMRDDTQLPPRSSRVCLFNAIDRFDASKKKRKKNYRATIYSHRSSTIYDKDSWTEFHIEFYIIYR